MNDASARENTRAAAADLSVEALLNRICSEYLEMPGLQLTRAQARRLWALDDPICDALLNVLVDVGFLVRTAQGTYKRRSDGDAVVSLRMAAIRLRRPASAARALRVDAVRAGRAAS